MSRAGQPRRQLIIRNPGVEYVIVRPTDAPAFVELGAADCGICGEDSLLEAQPEVVELADLKFGSCRFVVAEPAGAAEQTAEHYRRLGSIRIATKYPTITRAHYAKTGTQVEIVKLHGNIELAPLTGLAERIIDITATGTTLRENNLVIVEDVLSSTARFFANGTSLRTDARRGAGRCHARRRRGGQVGGHGHRRRRAVARAGDRITAGQGFAPAGAQGSDAATSRPGRRLFRWRGPDKVSSWKRPEGSSGVYMERRTTCVASS